MKLQLDKRFCIGCRTCEVACMDRWNLTEPLLSIDEQCSGKGGDLVVTYMLHSCLQCETPDCLEACAVGAIQKKMGIVKIDHSQCIVCGACSKACPTHSIHMAEKGGALLPFKCELCGGKPTCQEACPYQALVLV